MKKRMSLKAGWIFVAVFVGLHLLYCALNLRRCLLCTGRLMTKTARYTGRWSGPSWRCGLSWRGPT